MKRIALRTGWRRETTSVVLVWRERAGPSISSPWRTGFGSSLIERMLGSYLISPIERSWSSLGLDCTLRVKFATEHGGRELV